LNPHGLAACEFYVRIRGNCAVLHDAAMPHMTFVSTIAESEITFAICRTGKHKSTKPTAIENCLSAFRRDHIDSIIHPHRIHPLQALGHPNAKMANPSNASIVNVDRVRDGILVEFNDGQCVNYSTSLLLEMLPAATKVEDSGPDDGGESN
jgi:hypothetical protein